MTPRSSILPSTCDSTLPACDRQRLMIFIGDMLLGFEKADRATWMLQVRQRRFGVHDFREQERRTGRLNVDALRLAVHEPVHAHKVESGGCPKDLGAHGWSTDIDRVLIMRRHSWQAWPARQDPHPNTF